MSKTIDERVVEMRFDNKQFESNVKTSMSTIEKLKHSLNLTGASKGLENISSAARGFSLSGIGGAVETVQAKFSGLEVMAMTALANITNSAVNAGRQMLHSLTIEPVSQGFEEYELKMGSIQTIMNSTGEDLDTVNKYLNELNLYADKTIYSFSDMTSNIGKFTNSGVKLEDAVKAIQGVSNEAAVSGANANEASRAMYNFAQALSSGCVRLIDWKSIENANMATVEFKDELLKTALAMGTVIEVDGKYKTTTTNLNGEVSDLFDATSNFNDSLAHQWMTTDVLVETLGRYSDETTELGKKAFAAAQDVKTFSQLMDTLKEAVGSGWAMTWEILFGNFEEAKKVWTGISDTVGGFIDAQSDARNTLLQSWKDLGGRAAVIESVKNTLEGLAAVVKPIKEAFREIFPPVTAKQLYAFSKGLQELTSHFKISSDASKEIKNTFKGMFAVLDIVGQAFSAVFRAVFPMAGGLKEFGGKVLSVSGSFGELLANLDEFIKKNNIFVKAIQGITNFAENAGAALKDMFHLPDLGSIRGQMVQVGKSAGDMKSVTVTAIGAMGSALSNSNFLQALRGLWEGVKAIAGGIAKTLGGLISGFAEVLSGADFSSVVDFIEGLFVGSIAVAIRKFFDSVTSPIEGLSEILDSVRGCFEAYQTQLKAGALLKIASAIGILALSILVIASIDSNKLSASLGAITVMFADLVGSMALFSKIDTSIKGTAKIISTMLGISIAVLILATALKKIGDLDSNQLVTGLVGVASLTGIIVAAAKMMSSGSKTIVKGAGSMLILAAAVKVLASVCKDLSALSWEQLGKGLVGVGALLAGIDIFLNTAKFGKGTVGTAVGILLLSAAMKVLVSAVSDFGSMSWGEIARGLLAMGLSLLEVTAALKLMPKNTAGIGAGLLITSAALEIIAHALGKMGSMSGEGIAKGLIAMGGALGELALGLNLMKGTLGGSAALMVASVALAVLTPVLVVLGSMSWESIAKGLISIAGAFAVIGIAGLILTPLVPTILALGAAFALIGVGVLGIGAGLLAAGAGLSALAVGFSALAASGIAGAASVVAALTVIITGIAELIPVVMTKLGEGIIALCQVIAAAAPEIGEAFKAVVLTILDVLLQCVPQLSEGILSLFVQVLSSLSVHAPVIVDLLLKLLIGILESIADNLPMLIQAAVDVVGAFFLGVVEALKGVNVDTLVKGIAGVGLLAALMIALSAVLPLIPGAMAGVIGMGVVIAEVALVLAAIGALAQIPGLSWLIDEGGKLLEGIGSAIGSFVGGIVGGFMSGVSSSFPQIGSDLSSFMENLQPFIEGARKIDASTMDGVKALAETILILTAADILDGLTSWLTGGSSLSGFGEELVEFGGHFSDYYDSIKNVDGKAVEASANAAKTLSEFASTIPNEGGALAWWVGDNKLSSFAKGLKEFGPELAEYAKSISGVDGKAVEASANAAKTLSEFADTIPNEGGALAWWVGDNKLSSFAKGLKEFGPDFAEYADSISGVDGKAVEASANAASALSKFASDIPNSGGLISWFTGDNDISSFGKNLKAFGESFSEYSDSVSNIELDNIVGITRVVSSLSKLQNEISDNGQLRVFGNSLASFGSSFASYYGNIKNIEISQLSNTISQMNRLVAMAKGLEGFSGDGMSSFGSALTGLGQSGISDFIGTFENASSQVSKTAAGMMTNFVNGVKSQQSSVTTAFDSTVALALASLRNKYQIFQAAGQQVMASFISGIESRRSSVSNVFAAAIAGAAGTARAGYNDFYNTGIHLVNGFAAGINANTYHAAATASAMASAAANAARRALNVRSPSKVFYEIGNYAGAGFVNALRDCVTKAYQAGSGVAESAAAGLGKAVTVVSDMIESGVDTQPSIRPVVDLSEVRAGAGVINSLFSGRPALSVGAVAADAMSLSVSMRRNQNENGSSELLSAIKGLRKDLTDVSRDVYHIDGITYDDGSNVASAVKSLVRAAKIGRRV